MTTSTLRLGFACNWGRNPRATWSGTPWHLREALSGRVELRDVGLHVPVAVQAAFHAAYLRRSADGWSSMWRHTRPWEIYSERLLRRTVARSDCEAVLEVADLARLDVPYYVLQDLSYDVLLDRFDGHGVAHFPGLGLDEIRRRRDRQRVIYDGAAGLIAMSRWFADQLVGTTGLPPSKVHVVHPGATAVVADGTAASADSAGSGGTGRRRPRRRLLFVGRDFRTKAGDLVVEATGLLRRQWDNALTLTVAGPPRWPLPGEIPEGVRFLGPVRVEQVASLMDGHDLLVMPSRFEGFGIVFVEALARGLPCIGRRDFAMPEIIEDGCTGRLLVGDDASTLAALIVATLDDDAIYDVTWCQRHDVAHHFSWARAAAQIVDVVAAR